MSLDFFPIFSSSRSLMEMDLSHPGNYSQIFGYLGLYIFWFGRCKSIYASYAWLSNLDSGEVNPKMI